MKFTLFYFVVYCDEDVCTWRFAKEEKGCIGGMESLNTIFFIDKQDKNPSIKRKSTFVATELVSFHVCLLWRMG